jgi:hypothetical protein
MDWRSGFADSNPYSFNPWLNFPFTAGRYGPT